MLVNLLSETGHGSVARISGDPGVGKTALLHEVAQHARLAGVTVLHTRGSAEERHLSYAALHRLLRPLLDRVDALPVGQRTALNAVFGVSDGSRLPERFHIALATLELLAEAAQRRTILMIVDDRQWLDPGSLDVVEFVAARIEELAVVMIFAQRERQESGRGASIELELAGLDDDWALTLLQSRFPEASVPVLEDLAALALGNPLALTELAPHDLEVLRRPASTTTDPPLLTRRLQEAFGARFSTLSAKERLCCVVAAVQDGDELAETIAAARVATGDSETSVLLALAAGESTGLLRVRDGQILFRHPLVRAAVIAQASPAERAGAHGALATALADSPSRAACHRAAALTGTDEAVAAELEERAEAEAAAAATGLARTLMEHATRLSAPTPRRAHRVLRIAELAFQLGRYADVRPLIEQLRLTSLEAADQARLVGLEMAFDDGAPEGAEAVQRFVSSSVRALDAGDGALAAALLVVAARNTYWGATTRRLGPTIASAAKGLGTSRPETLLRLVLDAFLEPFGSAGSVSQAIAGLPLAELDDGVVGLLSQASFVIGDFEKSLSLALSAAKGLRRDGRLGFLAATLVLETFSALYLGDWTAMTASADEAERLSRETHQPVWNACARLGQANLSALRGDRKRAEALADAVEGVAVLTGNASVMNGVQLARGLAALGDGDPETAFGELARMFDAEDSAYQMPQSIWAVDYLLEAACSSGHIDDALPLLREVERQAALSPTAGVRRALTLASLMAKGPKQMAGPSVNVPATAWHRARTDLYVGAWLRRHRSPVEARPRLRSALATFEALGARAWTQRARSELAASGARSPRPHEPDGWSKLSPQELQVAVLASQGLTNRDIAARLFLSHRTVSSHLYRIYPKLGVTSRGQLHTVLGDDLSGLR